MGLLKDYLMLLRIHTAGVTAVVVLLGALLMGCRKATTLLLLFISGVLLHTSGFALNEVMDLPYDKSSPHLKHKPLVRESVKRSSALLLSIILFLLSITLFFISLQSVIALLLLLLSSLLGITYDLWGKRFPFSDLPLAGWFALLPVASSSAFGGPPPIIYLISLFLFLQILFNNSVEGGLKDLESDLESGARGTLIYLGAGRGGRLKGPALTYSLAVRLLLASAPLLPIFITGFYSTPLKGVIILFNLLLLIFSFKTLLKPPREREQLLKEFTLHEVGSFLLLILLLIPLLPVKFLLLLLLLPPIWNLLFTKLIYGRAGTPGV